MRDECKVLFEGVDKNMKVLTQRQWGTVILVFSLVSLLLLSLALLNGSKVDKEVFAIYTEAEATQSERQVEAAETLARIDERLKQVQDDIEEVQEEVKALNSHEPG